MVKDILKFEERNVTVYKKRVKITPRCNKLFHLWNRVLKKARPLKIIGKLEIIVIIQANSEAQLIKFDKDGNGSVITISSKVKFIDSVRFMAISLSNFVDNFTEEIYKIKCNDCVCFFKCESIKEKLISYRVLF